MNHTHLFEDSQHWLTLKQGLIKLAKQEVLQRFEHVTSRHKADGSVLTEADLQMQQKTAAFLKAHWPQFDFLGEESIPEAQNHSLNHTNGCWILDPVDGTSNFANGIPFYAISLALVVKGEIVLGLIYDPSRDELFSARKGLGAQLNDAELKAHTHHTHIQNCAAIVDFKRLKAPLATHLATKSPYASQRSFGSVALDWCWIAAGRGQLYCHGSQHLWDYAAGWIILGEAGGVSATLEGEPVYTKQVIKRSAIAATTPELFQQWQQIIERASSH